MLEKDVYKYLQQNFSNHSYCFLIETPKQIIDKYNIILLSGKIASFPPKMPQEAKVIILYPTLPPPDNFNQGIIKMELLPEHLNSFSSLWEIDG